MNLVQINKIPDASGSKASMNPRYTSSGWPRSITVTLKDVLRWFHIENLANASDAEATFLFRLYFRMMANAKILARGAEGNCPRAVQALVAALERNKAGQP